MPGVFGGPSGRAQSMARRTWGSRLRVLCVSFGRRCCCPCSGGVPDSEPADCRAAVFTCILSLERRVGEGQIGQCGHELPEGGHEGEL
jgi:hypothetical protein